MLSKNLHIYGDHKNGTSTLNLDYWTLECYLFWYIFVKAGNTNKNYKEKKQFNFENEIFETLEKLWI